MAVLVDFGSTFTKVAAVDLDRCVLLARSEAPSSTDTDISVGFEQALGNLLAESELADAEIRIQLASSSAAGGLRMVALGLVPAMTTEAAQRAALGAGANLLGAYSHELALEELREIEGLAPDLILLCGGTDGGNKDVLLANARLIAESSIEAPVVVAGNAKAQGEAQDLLERRGIETISAENVMPNLHEINVEPARVAIREAYLKHIVRAKGMHSIEVGMSGPVIPTPMAVMEAAELLSSGTERFDGWGDLIVVDVGGATTDIHSVAEGRPQDSATSIRGLPEPRLKRTVEGDLGLRVSASSLLARVDAGQVVSTEISAQLTGDPAHEWALAVEGDPSILPEGETEQDVDIALARAAVRLAIDRHVGTVRSIYTPNGQMRVLHGKDLSGVNVVIGTGGVFANQKRGAEILRETVGTVLDAERPYPTSPQLFVDRQYVAYAAGLLVSYAPHVAARTFGASLEVVQ